MGPWIPHSKVWIFNYLFICIFMSETEPNNDSHQAGPEIRDSSASDSHMLTHGHTEGFQQTYEDPKSWRAQLCGQALGKTACVYSVGQHNSQELVLMRQPD